MKIHKVEEKQMVIHTKEKAKIHRVEDAEKKRGRRKVSAKKATPKVKDSVCVKSGKKSISQYRHNNGKAVVLKRSAVTVDKEATPTRGKGREGYRTNLSVKAPGDSIKKVDRQHGVASEKMEMQQRPVKRNDVKSTFSLAQKEAKRVATTRRDSGLKQIGAAGARVATDQMEGGEEIQQAAMIAYELSRPVRKTADTTSDMMKQALLEERKRRLKVVDVQNTAIKQTTIKQVNSQVTKTAAKGSAKKVAKESTKKVAKESTKAATKKAAKETTKATAKAAAKTATKVATTAAAATAGTALAPGVGTAIGIAAGKVVGAAIEKKDMQVTNRNRKIKYFIDKMNSEEKQKDNILKLAKDLISKRIKTAMKTTGPIMIVLFMVMALSVSMIVVPVVATVGILYNSPFAIFLPPLEEGDTVMSVTKSYESDFMREVSTLAYEHVGYDNGYLVYAGPSSNYYDMMAVYMVKYGVGDTATIMKDKAKKRLAGVVDDMCDYFTATSSYTYTEIVDEKEIKHVVTTLYVYVTLKDYRDMIYEYGFDEDEVELLESLMAPENIGKLSGY